MKSPHILLLNKNVQLLKRELSDILSAASSAEFDAEVHRNVVAMFRLGEQHYAFAAAQQTQHWRQIVSRSYYGSYVVSKAVRLAAFGDYSRDSKDHSSVGKLPDDFPNQSTYKNRLGILRDDRNLCDYDHVASESDLAIRGSDAVALVGSFIAAARAYLRHRSIQV